MTLKSIIKNRIDIKQKDKMKKTLGIVLGIILSTSLCFAQNASEIIRKADQKSQGESSESEMDMTIVRPNWTRTVSFKSWSKGNTYSLTLITYPVKEKGQSFMKVKNEMWSWNPTINRMIKLPPSMLSQGWMGSDYTNDDMMKESSIVVDYTHKLIGEESIAGLPCYKIELTPKDEAAVVWSKLILWISKDEYYEMKSEFYDEDLTLVKTHLAADIKFMHDRKIPTKFTIIPADKPTQKTEVVMKNIKFNVAISDGFFTQQNMKLIR